MQRNRLLLTLAGVLAVLMALVAGAARAAQPGGAFTLTSSAFTDGGTFPSIYQACSADGTNTRPPLSWSGAPKGTKSFAIMLDDPDAVPPGTTFTHWITWNISAGRTTIGPGRSDRRVGANDLFFYGAPPLYYLDYFGPCPPGGTGVHHYTFHLSALSSRLDLPTGATRDQLLPAVQAVLLAETILVGTVDSGP